MSGSLESLRWNACEHRLDLGLYSLPKEFWGNGVRTHVNSRRKSPLPEKFSPEEYRTHDAASSRTASPTHNQRAIPAPLSWTKQGSILLSPVLKDNALPLDHCCSYAEIRVCAGTCLTKTELTSYTNQDQHPQTANIYQQMPQEHSQHQMA